MAEIVAQEVIENKIHVIRGKKVMLDRDLAELYGVTTGNLNKAMKRNIARFPDDFMFQLTLEETKNLMFQIGRSSWGGTRKPGYAFTENGVAMLSSVLSSERAILVNIQIMRAFVRMRDLVADHTDLRKAIEHIERRLDVHDQQIKIAFAALKSILQPEPQPATPAQLPPKEYSPGKEKKMGFGKATLKKSA